MKTIHAKKLFNWMKLASSFKCTWPPFYSCFFQQICGKAKWPRANNFLPISCPFPSSNSTSPSTSSTRPFIILFGPPPRESGPSNPLEGIFPQQFVEQIGFFGVTLQNSIMVLAGEHGKGIWALRKNKITFPTPQASMEGSPGRLSGV